MKSLGFQELFEALQDKRTHIGIGLIKKVIVASDRSFVRTYVQMLPEEREIVAMMSWDAVGPESGIFSLPVANDLVLVAFVEGDINQAYVFRRLTSKEDKVPLNAASGDLVLKALSGKKAWVTGSTVNITKDDSQPTENMVLGQKLKTAMTQLIDAIKAITVVGNMGSPTSTPLNSSTFETIKSNFLSNDEILSDFSYISDRD